MTQDIEYYRLRAKKREQPIDAGKLHKDGFSDRFIAKVEEA